MRDGNDMTMAEALEKFTRNDVAFLREFIANYEIEWDTGEWGGETGMLRSILGKIELQVSGAK